MTTLNRPLTSREYKLMLNVDHFRDRKEGAKDLWELVKFLAERKKGKVINPKNENKLYKIEKRRTQYLDTPGFDLRRNNFVLRLREELDDNENAKEFKLTLKYRSSDRYDSAHKNLEVRHKDKDKSKFEEDIVAPFISKFSHSASIESKKSFKKKEVNKIDNIIEWFPGLKTVEFSDGVKLIRVNNFVANEVALKFNRRIIFPNDEEKLKDDDFEGLKPCISFWYLIDHLDKLPLVGEFSFDYDALDIHSKDKKKTLETFPMPAVIGAGQLFKALQKQVNWMNPTSTTKTAYAYSGF